AMLLGGALPRAHAAPTVSAELLEVTPTSGWPSPSPDPTGLTFMRSKRKLLVSDAEVDETRRLWAGGNLFITSQRGALVRTRSVLPTSPEPEDIAWRNRTRTLYLVDDDRNRVYRIRPGRDDRIGTADDRRKVLLRTRSFGSRDPEGLAWRERGRALIVTDARLGRVFIVRAGRDRRFGTRDDRVASFSTRPLGLSTPEDVEFDPGSSHLLLVSSVEDVVAETTMHGRLVRTIDFSAADVRRAAGITIAPSRADRAVTHLFIIGKGVDNASDRHENDGELFRFVYPA
ncbi:MAG: SdiA-regulated domain-containing protein, partial [Actinomycetota bacterium]